ncbi:hypothetical protein BHM03_00000034 [Ensete ventricosum]|nr:hypothetical protein BHM03_00000034 [Ensete ventricosum]
MKECGLETQYLSIQFPNSQKKPQSSSTDQSLQPNPPIIWKTLSFSPLRHQTATTEEQQQDDEFKLQIDRSEQFKDSRGEFCAARASSFLDEAFKQFPIASCEDPSRIGGGKDSVFPRKAAEEGEEKTARSINDERASMAASVRLPLKGPWLFQELRFRHNVTASSRCSSAITITRSIPVIRLLALRHRRRLLVLSVACCFCSAVVWSHQVLMRSDGNYVASDAVKSWVYPFVCEMLLVCIRGAGLGA